MENLIEVLGMIAFLVVGFAFGWAARSFFVQKDWDEIDDLRKQVTELKDENRILVFRIKDLEWYKTTLEKGIFILVDMLNQK